MKRPLALMLYAVLLVQGLTGCTKTIPSDPITGPSTYEQEMDLQVNGFNRTYRVHVPVGYESKAALPLVVVIHGAFDTAEGMEAYSGFSRLADEEGFLVLYPNGMGLFGFLQHWNAGHCCGKAAKDKVDDVGFIAAAVQDVCARLKVDRRRIYVLGFSNGGMMAYRFAAERSHLLAAAAALAASIGGRPSDQDPSWCIPDPQEPLPILIMHGMRDQDVPFEGGQSQRRGGPRTYWSVEDSVAFWVKHDGCTRDMEEKQLHGGQVVVRSWQGCQENSEVILYMIKDWAHDWPGTYFTSQLPQDHPLRRFDAARIIWEFFKGHLRSPGGVR
ncbi:MAG: alpha/beta hydrolase family esterase [Desulfobacteraceae bacterium]